MGCQCVKQENQLDQPTEKFSSPNQTKQLKSKKHPFSSIENKRNITETNNTFTGSLYHTNQKIISHDIFSTNKKVTPKGYPQDTYSAYLFNNINEARKNPQLFIQSIREGMNNIVLKTMKKNNKEEHRFVYSSKVKVALYRGRPAFEDAIEYLTKLEPLEPLSLDENICVKVPETEEEIKDKKYIIKGVEDINKNEVKVVKFFRDVVRDPETSFILMLADDNENKTIKKDDIFNKEYRRIGITSKTIGKNFAAYITFAL